MDFLKIISGLWDSFLKPMIEGIPVIGPMISSFVSDWVKGGSSSQQPPANPDTSTSDTTTPGTGQLPLVTEPEGTERAPGGLTERHRRAAAPKPPGGSGTPNPPAPAPATALTR